MIDPNASVLWTTDQLQGREISTMKAKHGETMDRLAGTDTKPDTLIEPRGSKPRGAVMAIILGALSIDRLGGVHPDLVRVVKRAAAIATAAEDFTILEGVRSVEQMYINYGKGRTVAQLAAKGVPAKYAEPNQAKVTWLGNPLMSNHRKMADGFGRAVDLAPFPIDWNNFGRFKAIMALMKRAAALERVAIVCGGDWSKPDLPHFEMAA